jgi:hypothetical protein
MYKDKNGTILKIGDRIQNKQGEVRKLENINGVAMAVKRDTSMRIVETTVVNKIDFNHMEKVV